jgi:hypothetical protein
MQDETAFGLHRPPLEHRGVLEVLALEGQFQFGKQVGQMDVGRLVDDQTQGTAVAVLAHVDHAAPE